MDAARYIVYQARMREEEPAIAFAGGVATYGLLVRAMAACAARLAEHRLAPGAVTAVHLHNPFRHAALLLALALLGRTSASISGRAQVEFAAVVPQLVLSDEAGFELPGAVVVAIDDSWFEVDPTAPIDYAAMLGLAGFTDPDAVVRVVFSSGTTGYPKAVGTTLRVLQASLAHVEMMQAGPHRHALRGLNMMGFSTAGSLSALLIALGRGGMLAFTHGPDDALRLIRAFGIEVLAAAVVQLRGVLKALGNNPPPSSLRTVIAAGASIPPQLLLETRARLCPNLNISYGSSEAGAMSFGTGAVLDRQAGSAGYVLPWVALETVDADDRPVAAGTDGIIRVKTPEQCHYLAPTTETDAMFRDGWFYPGDVGRLHPDGLLTITGRVSEIINRGGVIVAPDMVEEVLRSIPGVVDVAVFGAPDADGIEQICAAVVSEQWVDPAAIRTAAAVRLPDRVPEIVFQLEAIPRNDMGKVRRKELRQSFIEGSVGG